MHISSPSTIIDDIRFPDDDSQRYCSCIPDFKENVDRLYSDAQLSTLQAVIMLFTWFSMFSGMSKEVFNKLLSLLHDFILPIGNNLPASYSEAKKMIDPYLSPVTEYHCCINDCIIYQDCRDGKYNSLRKCPVCDEPRFEENGKTPRKVFKYLSVATRIARLFSDPVTSQLVQNHSKFPTC